MCEEYVDWDELRPLDLYEDFDEFLDDDEEDNEEAYFEEDETLFGIENNFPKS